MLKAVLAFGLGAYLLDVVVQPKRAAQKARAAANLSGKPVLNIGAGTPKSSVRAFLLGPTTFGDINMDIAAPQSVTCTKNRVCYGDIYSIPYPDKHFGAAIASHVLEHLEDPNAALRELQRVADEVFVVVPKWWAPHTWAHPGHKWYINQNGAMTRIR